MQVAPHVYAMHIDDGAPSHPGGSNNFFVGDPKKGMVLIDTGEHQRKWTQAILKEYKDLGKPKIKAILITHGHNDHVGGVDRVWDVMQAPVRCHPKLAKRVKELVGEDFVQPLKSREMIDTGGGVKLRALYTPGHEIDHICYYLRDDRIMFTGDTVLGSSSSTVRDLGAYMKSLQTLMSFKYDIVCPAHGEIVQPPRGPRLVGLYLKHRQEREAQVIDALKKGAVTVDDIVKHVYPRNLKKALRGGAARNVTSHLEKLSKEGRVKEAPAKFAMTSKRK